MPTVVEHEDAAAELHLLELVLVAAQRDVPAAGPAAHHLQVIAGDLADLTGLDGRLEPLEGLVEEVVLHDAELPVVGLRR